MLALMCWKLQHIDEKSKPSRKDIRETDAKTQSICRSQRKNPYATYWGLDRSFTHKRYWLTPYLESVRSQSPPYPLRVLAYGSIYPARTEDGDFRVHVKVPLFKPERRWGDARGSYNLSHSFFYLIWFAWLVQEK